jgi:Lysine-specific metallo-endopeptidase
MSRQSQWLFEAPLTSNTSYYSDLNVHLEFEDKPENEFKTCNDSQKRLIQRASDQAMKSVAKAEAFVGSAYGRPSKMSPNRRQLLVKHFHTTDRDDLREILGKLLSIRRALEKGLSIKCEATTCKVQGWCGYANTTQVFGGFGDIHICFDQRNKACNFANLNFNEQQAVVIHEVAHRHVGIDRDTYYWSPGYSQLSPKKAMNNADSYAWFSVEMGLLLP